MLTCVLLVRLVLQLLLLLLSTLLVFSMNAKQIARSFQASNFESAKGLFGIFTNCHYQTIVGSEALRVKLIGNIPRNFQTSSQRFETRDSDFFDVEFSDNIETSLGVVVVLHGLESSTKGPLVTKMASSFINAGFAVCLMSFRGCNGDDNLTQGAYHLGFTTDVHQLVEYINNKYPKLNIYLSGFSLGGNVCLKYLSEIGENCIKLNCKGAVVTSVPFDPVASQHKIDQGFNRFVYSENFLATLKVLTRISLTHSLTHPLTYLLTYSHIPPKAKSRAKVSVVPRKVRF